MGFLKNLLKQEAGKIISNVVENVVENLNNPDGVNTSATSHTTQTATRTRTTTNTSPSDTNPDEEDCHGNADIVNYRIIKAFSTDFKEYTLRGNIPASEMGASEGARDYTYGIFLNGTPKAMIMVLDVPSHYRKKDVLLAHEACQRRGVYCMNLMLHLPNRLSYITKQLRDNIKK